MRRGHILVIGIALAGAALAFFGTDRDRLVHSLARIAVEEESVRADLERIEQQVALGGYTVVSRVPITEPDELVLPVQLEQGCAIVASGAWGDLELASLSATSHAGLRHRARLARYLRLHKPLTQHVVVCHSGASHGVGRPAADGSSETLHASVLSRRLQNVSATGGGETIVLLGTGPVPPIVAGRMVPVEEDIYEREVSNGEALVSAGVVFFLLSLLGLMAHVVLSRGTVSQDGQSSLRRLSIAVPSQHRASLGPLVAAADQGDLAGARALRDALASIVDDMQAAAWEADRASTRRIAMRVPKLLDALRRRGGAAAADYRSRGAGSVVVTLVLQHECELPDFPQAVRRDLLPDLLAGLLPDDKRQLTAVRVLLHPADPSQTLDDAGLAKAFPELQRFDSPRAAKSA